MDCPRVRTASPSEALREALSRLDAGGRVVVATVLKRRGSTPSTPGQKLALLGHDDAVGTVGGGAVERAVLDKMRSLLSDISSGPVVVRHELGASMGMCCGGAVELLLEPMDANLCVLVVGAGHVGGALVPMLAALGFRLTVTDARDAALETRGLTSRGGLTALDLEYDDPLVGSALGPPERAAILVMTHDHTLDQDVIEWALRRGAAFVGGVGSRAKAARTRQRLQAKGFSPEDIERVRMPLGVDIGARTPGEIAVSIAGELVQWRARFFERARRERPASP